MPNLEENHSRTEPKSKVIPEESTGKAYTILDMLDDEYAQKVARGEIDPNKVKKEVLPPAGWLTDVEAIGNSGIPEYLFEGMLQRIDPRWRPGRQRQDSYISEVWVEFYKMDPVLATRTMFQRFVVRPLGELRLIEITQAETFSRQKYPPTKKQLITLWKLIDNPLLNSSERWLLELFKSDGRITKGEVQSLLDYFFGESDWDGNRRIRWTSGVLRGRQRTQN